MGDRGNIQLKGKDFGSNGVWFYTHWRGSELRDIAFIALQRAQEAGRLGDAPYLARIVFDTLAGEDNRQEVTGCGISARLQDNENPILVMDADSAKIWEAADPELPGTKKNRMPSRAFQTFLDEAKAGKWVRPASTAEI